MYKIGFKLELPSDFELTLCGIPLPEEDDFYDTYTFYTLNINSHKY